MEDNQLSLEVYLSDPKVQNKRMKLQHILGATVLLLMGTAFIYYLNYPFLVMVGIISVLTALVVFYFLLPKNIGRLVSLNYQLRWMEVGSYVLLAIGFLMKDSKPNAFFMLLMAISYVALIYFEKSTSNVREINFGEEGITFSSPGKKFFFKKPEITLIKIKGDDLIMKFNDKEFLNFQLVQQPSQETINYLEKDYLNGE